MGLRDWWSKTKEKPITDVIRHKHKFVVMDNDSFKEKLSFQLSGINLFVTVGAIVIVLIVLTTVLIAFTPLREMIPGYTDSEMVEQTYQNATRIDSLETQLAEQEWLIATMQAVMRGDEVVEQTLAVDSTTNLQHLAVDYRHSREDSMLRAEVLREDSRYQVRQQRPSQNQADQAPAFMHLFFPPIHGTVQAAFSASERQYGIEVSAGGDQPVKAAYSGTVVYAGFAAEAGNIMVVQHPGNVISVYRNLSALLKHQGDVVRAGEPVAYAGSGTDKSRGPYLHFEIWISGTPVDPQTFISF